MSQVNSRLCRNSSHAGDYSWPEQWRQAHARMHQGPGAEVIVEDDGNASGLVANLPPPRVMFRTD